MTLSGSKREAMRAVIKRVSKARPIDFATFHQRIEQRMRQIIGRQDLRVAISEMKREGELADSGHGKTRLFWRGPKLA